MGFRPSHRDPEELQPEICEVTGRLVPVRRMIEADVDGLRGVVVGDSAPWIAEVRTKPSWNDLRRQTLHGHYHIERDPPYGGRAWFRDLVV